MSSSVRRASAATSCAPVLFALAVLAHGGCARDPGEQLGQHDSSIIGGRLDTTSRGIVSLLTRVEGGYFPACTGTLLAPNLVLTARHCVADLNSPDGQSVECDQTTFGPTHPASDMIVSVEANVGREGLDPYQVAQIWLAPLAGDAVCGKDIAMLRLADLVPADVAQPIAPRLDDEVAANEQFAAIGYGLQDPNDQSGETLGHRMRVDGAQVFCTGTACDADFVVQGEWIAESPVCSGDSGGPALDGDGRVAGVTSRGDAECTLGIYTSVYAWADFVRQSAFDAAAAGGYAPPTWAGEPPSDFPMPSGGSSGTAGSGGSNQGTGGATPIIVGGTSSSMGGRPSSPTVDALGLACSGRCPGTYQCWSASDEPPGICVPPCGASLPECPRNFTCSAERKACEPTQALESKSRSQVSSGCSVTGSANTQRNPSWLALLALSALAARWRRPRR